MAKFLAILATIWAINLGGWAWLVAVVMIGYAFGDANDATSEDEDNQAEDSSASNGDGKNGESNWGISEAALSTLCRAVQGNDYFILDLIPNRKRANAMEKYPPRNNGKMIALFDFTVFGSAKNGLVISTTGISWNGDNGSGWVDWGSFKWLEIKKAGLLEFGDIRIGPLPVSTAGTAFPKQELLNLLKKIQSSLVPCDGAYEKSVSTPPKTVAQHSTVHATKPEREWEDAILVDLNSADFDELLKLPGVGLAEAKRLLDARETSGYFSDIETAIHAFNVKPHYLSRIKERAVIVPREEPADDTHDFPSDESANNTSEPSASGQSLGRLID